MRLILLIIASWMCYVPWVHAQQKTAADDQLVVDNDGSHSVREKSGFIALKKGLHKIKFEYFEDFDGELIQLDYEGKGSSGKRQVPLGSYSHQG